MFDRRWFKWWTALMMTIFTVGFIYLGHYCTEKACSVPHRSSTTGSGDGSGYRKWRRSGTSGFDDVPNRMLESVLDADSKCEFCSQRKLKFDVESDADVMVFLHIQKTGGTTFGKHLVQDAGWPCACYRNRKRCDCQNSKGRPWLFSRYSTGWACGLHADWTELHDCIQAALDVREGRTRNRRYLYITILRDPVYRYLSEWKHVQRGSTWFSAKLMCDGRPATLDEVPFCFQGRDWTGVSLDDFMSCPHNLAHNRQTRMLANLSLVSCYKPNAMSSSVREATLLASAKENIRQMAFFGLTEYQAETQYMFERIFNVRFVRDFSQYKETHAGKVNVTQQQWQEVVSLNKIDVELYRYAKDLFFRRLQEIQKEDMSLRTTNTSISPRNSSLPKFQN